MTVTDMNRRTRARRPARAEIDAVQAQPSQAAQVRYACEHMDAPLTPERIRSWLEDRGVTVGRRESVSRAMNAWKNANGQPVTPPRGISLDQITRDVTPPVTPEVTPEPTEIVMPHAPEVTTDHATARVTAEPPPDLSVDTLMVTRDRTMVVTPGGTVPVTPEITTPVTPEVTHPVTRADAPPVTPVGTLTVTRDDTVAVTPEVTAPVTPEVTVTVTPEVTPDPAAHRASARTELVGNAALVVPLLLVNAVAVYGQVQWAHEHLTPGSRYWFVAVGFALAVESIGVYLAAEAHRALLAGDASLRLRLGSYAVGVLAGALNYAHFAPKLDAPNTQAIVFGVLSAISPILWAIRSRSISRDRLRALQLIDGRSVKFTAAQWLLFPRRSARAFRAAVWAGETNPTRARALVSVPADAPKGAAPTA